MSDLLSIDPALGLYYAGLDRQDRPRSAEFQRSKRPFAHLGSTAGVSVWLWQYGRRLWTLVLLVFTLGEMHMNHVPRAIAIANFNNSRELTIKAEAWPSRIARS